MKRTICAAMSLIASILTGCSNQSESPTAPSSDRIEHVAEILQKREQNVSHGAPMSSALSSNPFHIDAALVDPLNNADTIEVVADVKYELEPQPILRRDVLNVSITIEGTASSSLIDGPDLWTVWGKSMQTVSLGWNNRRLIELAYSINGTSDNLRLHVQYVVTLNRVTVQQVWLVRAGL